MKQGSRANPMSYDESAKAEAVVSFVRSLESAANVSRRAGLLTP